MGIPHSYFWKVIFAFRMRAHTTLYQTIFPNAGKACAHHGSFLLIIAEIDEVLCSIRAAVQ